MTNSKVKRQIEKATGTTIKLSSWKCDSHYEGHAEAYANCEKVRYHTGYTKWTGDIVMKGEQWEAKTKEASNRGSLLALAINFELHDIADEIIATIETIRNVELAAYCGVTDLNHLN